MRRSVPSDRRRKKTPMNAPAQARKPGDFVSGKWKLERVVRVSATATSYTAALRDGSRVGLTILHRHLATDAEVTERFRREAYAANAIGHQGVVKIVEDDTTEDGCAVLVTDPIEGEPLEDLRRAWGGRLPLDVAADFVGQLLEILAVAHDVGVVHRELQPDSLVIAAGGQVRLCDFGIAKLRSEPGVEDELTQNGILLAPPPFMAPEQALGRPELVDAQTDIFAAGAILFLLLTGQGLHTVAGAPLALTELIAASTKKARSLRAAVGSDLVPDAVVEAVDRAIAFRKSERWLDARSFATALREACAGTLAVQIHPADDAEDPTWTMGPELEPEILANLKAAQGIAPSAPPPPLAAPSVPPAPAPMGQIFEAEPEAESTIPVPDSVVLAARLAGTEIPGTAPAAKARPAPPEPDPYAHPDEAAFIPKAPSSRRLVRKVAPSAPRLAAVEVSPPPPPPDEDLASLHDEPMTSVAMYPPRRGPDVPADEASVIVNATPVPPPMPQPPARKPPVQAPPVFVPPRSAMFTPDAFAPGLPIPQPASSSQRISALDASGIPAPPPSRRRSDDATVLLMPKAAPVAPSSSGRWIVVAVVVVATIAAVLVAANVFLMRR
jgi:serine/threonine-protein kinase